LLINVLEINAAPKYYTFINKFIKACS